MLQRRRWHHFFGLTSLSLTIRLHTSFYCIQAEQGTMVKTLTLPIVGVENLAQYAVQEMIDKRGDLVKRYIDSDYVYPYTSGAKNDYSTGWEHYVADNEDDIMQLHSPVIAGCESLFAKQLATVVAECGYTRVILVDAVENVPAELEGVKEYTPFVKLLREAMPETDIVHEPELVTEMAVRLGK